MRYFGQVRCLDGFHGLLGLGVWNLKSFEAGGAERAGPPIVRVPLNPFFGFTEVVGDV